MPEYFIQARSFAAPFVSDESTAYGTAATPEEALTAFATDYRHPMGLYAAEAYESADAYHKRQEPLARWLCNHEREKQRLTALAAGYSYRGNGPGDFELNGERVKVDNPKAGSVV